MATRFGKITPVLFISSCAILGYLVGVGNRRAEALSNSTKSERSMRATGSVSDVMVSLDHLLSALGTETDTWAIISRLPADKIPDALNKLRQIRNKAVSLGEEARRLDEIASALYYRWAEIDPQAALADALKQSPDSRRKDLLSSVLAAWIKSDPDAAFRATKDDEKTLYTASAMLTKTWSMEDLKANLKRYPDHTKDFLRDYCKNIIGDPIRRDSMLQMLLQNPKLPERDWGMMMLFRSWGYEDFKSAINQAQLINHTAMVNLIIHDNLSGPQAAEAIPWAYAHGYRLSGPDCEQGYGFWLQLQPEGARKWLSDQTPKLVQEGNYETLVNFIAVDRINFHTEEAAAKLNDLVRQWQLHDEAAAKRWISDASPDIKNLIQQ